MKKINETLHSTRTSRASELSVLEMKNLTLSILALAAPICVLCADVINSPEINQRIWALLDVTYPVDVDMDGTNDVYFYGDIDLLVQNSEQAAAIHLRIATASNVFVSCFNIPVGPGPDGNPSSIAAFTTFVESENIGADLNPPDWPYEPLLTWESGDLPFHGFDIAGGIPSRDSYLGVKIEKETHEYYGWIRLIFPISYDYFDQTSYVKIKESSYQSTPSSPVIAGLGKTEKASSYSNHIEISGAGTFALEVNGVSNMQCMLQESLDLSDWDTISVEYSTQPNLTKSISTTGTSKFYRWQVTENLEEID
ncbi:hypothetical protein ACWPKO_07005 [Coraliomargarita sp. W4R53]